MDRGLIAESILQVWNNQLKWLPTELGQLTKLEELHVRRTLGPFDLAHDLSFWSLQLAGNPLSPTAGLLFEFTTESAWSCARRIDGILAATTHIGFIRERATEVCIGLQDLELPAFVTLTIIDAAMHENSIRMWAKWELITAVKHFRQRRGVEH
jgi:hypothetical protein